MSVLLNGVVADSEQSKNARGGTEMMRDRLIKYVEPELLQDVAIHFSRSPGAFPEIINIFYAHDLVQDPANQLLRNGGWEQFDHFVFVSYWQRTEYMLAFGIPQDRTSVIQNAIETPKQYPIREVDGVKRFIYHTTPHRGLQLLVPVFDQISQDYPGQVHLDVFSSFSIYGWEQRDEPFKPLFDAIEKHPAMTYHGAQPNAVVLEALHKADVFLYPCIWKETSCIAAIEAMAHGTVVIHPDLAALPETCAYGPSMSYDWTSDAQEHMNRAYSAAQQFIEAPEFHINRFVAESFTPKSAMLNVNHFMTKWSILLVNLKDNLLEDDNTE